MDQYKLLGLALLAIAVYDIYVLFHLPKAGRMVLAVLFAACALGALLLGGGLLSGLLPMA
jgi:hypothetical protein